MAGRVYEGLEVAAEEEGCGGVPEGAGEEDVVTPQEGNAVEWIA